MIPKRICPYLSSTYDPDTAFDFSTLHNECHAGKKPTLIIIPHQDFYCLTTNHKNCPVYRKPELADYDEKIDFITNLQEIERSERNLDFWSIEKKNFVYGRPNSKYLVYFLFTLGLIVIGLLINIGWK